MPISIIDIIVRLPKGSQARLADNTECLFTQCLTTVINWHQFKKEQQLCHFILVGKKVSTDSEFIYLIFFDSRLIFLLQTNNIIPS